MTVFRLVDSGLQPATDFHSKKKRNLLGAQGF